MRFVLTLENDQHEFLQREKDRLRHESGNPVSMADIVRNYISEKMREKKIGKSKSVKWSK